MGEERWVSASAPLPYTIRFENDPDLATAPALDVRITQIPDADLNPASFRLGSFGFGPFTFEVPANRAFYSARLETADSLGVNVDVTMGLDVQAGTLFWTFRSIDPATGLPPTDPLAGFLPVNDSTSIGEGFVTYTIRPDDEAVTGARIDAKADIVFDTNDPIITPPIFNTLDASPPESRAVADAEFVNDASFLVRWSGLDEGAGLGTYDVFLARDDGPFELYRSAVTDTALAFNGTFGQTYRFYTRATDAAGNAEAAKNRAETSVVVGASLTAYPGDTNNDGTVNEGDVLPVGTFFGQRGPLRPRAAAFDAEPALPWTPEPATYADASGNGVVDQNDVLPVDVFFGQSRSSLLSRAAPPSPDGDRPFLSIPPLLVGTPVLVHVEAGHAGPIDDLLGVSSTVQYPSDVFELDRIEPADALRHDRLLPFTHTDESGGRVSFALTRTAGTLPVTVEQPTPLATVVLRVARPMEDVAQVTFVRGSAGGTTGILAGGHLQIASPQALDAAGGFRLEANYPNPARTYTIFRYALPTAEDVTIELYDVLGRRVQTVKRKARTRPGWHADRLDTQRLASGVYFYRIRAGSYSAARKLTIVR